MLWILEGNPVRTRPWRVYVKGQCFSAPNMQCVCAHIIRGDWPHQEGWLGSQGDSQGRNRVFFFPLFCHFLQLLPAPGHCINKCLGRYTSKKKHKYCTRERIPSPSPPTVPRKTLQILHMALPSPVGSRPGRVFGRSSRDRGPGQPMCPLSTHPPHHDWVHWSSQRAGKGLDPTGQQVLHWECFHKDGRQTVQARVCPWSDTHVRVCQWAWKRQAGGGCVGGRVLGHRGQGHTLHRRRWFVLSSRPTVSLLPPPPLLSRKSS